MSDGFSPVGAGDTPLELIDRITALIPPPSTDRHRYRGVLAPSAPVRSAVTALAPLSITPAGRACD